MKKIDIIAAVLLLALLAACSGMSAVPSAPAMAVPDRYTDQPDPPVTEPPPSGQSWWKQFGSPELDQLVEEGLQNSPDLQAARLRLQAGAAQLEAETGNSTLPSVDLGAQAARQRALGLPNFGPAYTTALYNSFAAQLQANYTVDLFGAVSHANQASALRYQSQVIELQAAHQALALNIVSAVITAASLHDALDRSTRMATIARQQADDAARRQALGTIGLEDMQTEQGNAAGVAAAVPATRAQLDSTRHALAVLLGRFPAAAPPALHLDDLHFPAATPLLVPSALLQRRPDILAAAARVNAAAEDLGVANARMYPQLTLSASMGRGGFDWGPALAPLWGTGVALTAPLFHGGALSAGRRAAESAYQASLEDYRKTVLAAFQETADLLANLDDDTQRLDALTNAASAARSGFDAATRRVALGAIPADLGRAREIQWQRAAQDVDQLRATRLLDSARLMHAVGD